MISLEIAYISSIAVWGMFVNWNLYTNRRRPLMQMGGSTVDFFTIIVSYLLAPVSILGTCLGLFISLFQRKK